MSNTKHAAAQTQRADRISELRTNIHTTLHVIAARHAKLQEIADERHAASSGFSTPESRAARSRQDGEDRAAARGIPTHTNRSFVRGLRWMSGVATKAPGLHPAPAAMPVISIAAEITMALQHHVARLARPALLVALEAEQTALEDTATCPWPRNPIAADPPTTDCDVDRLATHLTRLVDHWNNRPGLEQLLRDLDRLEQLVFDVIEGPAKTNWPDPCPWCGRDSLVIHHRAPGREHLFVTCEGRHPCECDDPWCACHRSPITNRHEWIHSARVHNSVDSRSPHALTSLIARRKEATLLEAKATAARERALALHDQVPIYPWAQDCPNTDDHESHWGEPDDGNGLICFACDPIDTVCGTCHEDDGSNVAHPCPTVRALELDQPDNNQGETP